MKLARELGWPDVVRLGLVQGSIGAVVVLMTATLNRVMVIELGLPASVPGALVALHFAIQFVARPRLGHQSDAGGPRTRTILLGMLLLGVAGALSAASVALIATHRTLGLAASVGGFALIGCGVSAAGTPLLALLADGVRAERRARAAAIVWLMMIAGFIVTTVLVGNLIDPFSWERLVLVSAGVGAGAVVVSAVALLGLEPARLASAEAEARGDFKAALRAAWAHPTTRRFALFVFVAMLGYSAQDLVLEPFAGSVFGLTPGESTKVSGMHQGGMLVGMLLAAAFAVRLGGLTLWAAGGCAFSAVAFLLLSATPMAGSLALLKGVVVLLGVANGAFAIGAIGSMMVRARGDDAGLRMGIFGAAQAVAYAIGGFLGALGSDVARAALGDSAQGYAAVFVVEAFLFLAAAVLVKRADEADAQGLTLSSAAEGDALLAALR